jgi:hypothetical protein
MRGEAVVIGNKKVTRKTFLKFQKVLYRTKVISKVQLAGWPNATDYRFAHDANVLQKCEG